MLIMLLLLYSSNKISANNGILIKGDLIPNYLSNPEDFCSLMNLNFLFSHALYQNNRMDFQFSVVVTFVSTLQKL